MSTQGYRDPDEEDYVIQRDDSKAVFYVLFVPVVIGGYLLVKGVTSGGYLMAGIGALILVAIPVMIYVAWHRSY